jgi:chromosome segregation ATPase
MAVKSPEKPRSSDAGEEDISALEGKFQAIIGEMTDLRSARALTATYQRLCLLISDAHGKNQQLAKYVQGLNSQIVTNATKVAGLLSMSEDDRRCIERYRMEFERAWKVLSASQAKELKLRDVSERMKQDVVQLTDLVHKQNTQETYIDGVRLDIVNFESEMKSRLAEMKTIGADFQRVQRAIVTDREKQERAMETARMLKALIGDCETSLNLLRESQHRLMADIATARSQNKGMRRESNEMTNQVAKIKQRISAHRQELHRERTIQAETAKETEGAKRSLREVLAKRDRLLSTNNQLETSIVTASSRLERDLEEEKILTAKHGRVDAVLEASREEMRKLNMVANEIDTGMDQTRSDRRHLNRARLNARRENAIAEARAQTAAREHDATAHASDFARHRLADAQIETDEVRGIVKITSDVLQATKVDIQGLDIQAASYEREMVSYVDRSTGIRIQSIGIEDNFSHIQTDLADGDEMLNHLQTSLCQHDSIIRDVRHERDIMATRIEAISKENDSLSVQLSDLAGNLNELKAKSEQTTVDSIDVHFQTRGTEKQNGALGEVVSMTMRLNHEAQQTITGYAAEHQKLNKILEEANQDIHLAKAEVEHVNDVSDLMHRQLSSREESVRDHTIELRLLERAIERRGLVYSTQSSELLELSGRLQAQIALNQQLCKGATYVAHLKIDIISLESRIRRESGIRGRVEGEFELPRNVHRWTLMKIVQPQRFFNIQMTQYIRMKIERAKREQLELDEERKQLRRRCQRFDKVDKKGRIKNGAYAIQVCNESLQKKDAEMRRIEGEIEAKRAEAAAMEQAVVEMRGRLQRSQVATTTIKLQKRQQFGDIPLLHINRTMDRTRLGGGFGLNSERSQGNRTFITQPAFVPPEDEEEEKRTRPATARTCARPVAFPQRPQTGRPSSNFGCRSDAGSDAGMVVTNSARSESSVGGAPKEKMHKAKKKTTVTKVDNAKRTPPSSVSSEPTVSRMAQSARRTKTDLRPIGPYFGPM